MGNQLADSSHHEQSEQGGSQTVDVLEQDDPMFTLMFISGDHPIFDDIEDLNSLRLGHPIVELRDEEVLELYEGSRSFHALNDFAEAALPVGDG